MKKIYSILSLLLLCSIVAFADSERVVIANDVASHVVINSIEGNVVTLTVTPAEGQYLADISAMKTVDASAAAPIRRADIPVGAAYTLTKTSATADRSQEATYTMTLEDGFGAYVTATFADRTAITADQITLSAESFTYNGSDQKATVSIDGLTLDTDYTISYKETAWTNAGTYTVTITGIDSYKGTIEKTWSINACQSSEAVIALAIPTEGYTYDGTEKTPAVTVTIGTMTVADTEYTVSYTNNVNAGTASVTVEDKQGGNFAFTTQTTAFEIGKKTVTVTADSDSKTYDGMALTKNTYTSTVLAEGDVIESVTVTGSQTEVGSSDNVPSAAVIKNANNVDVTDCYSITYVNGTLTVNACQSSEAVIALAIPTEGYTYDGTEKTPAVTVTIGTMTVADTEYTVSYTDNVNAGTATVTVEDKQGGNFAFAPVSKTFEIGKKAVTITADSDSKIYDGMALTKNTYTSTVLAEGDVIESVTVTGSQTEVGSSDNVPSAAVIKNAKTVDVTNCYSITYVNGTLTVNACQSSEAVIALAIPTEGYTYDGTEKTPAVTVTIGTMTVADTEYTVSYTNNVNAGTATVTVEDKQGGNFAFAPVSKTYEIGKKAVTVTADSDSKTYDGTALTKNTYTSTVLAEGDVIESVTVTGSQTEVGSSDNVPGAAVIKNANNVDVTDCYSITYVNGTLTVNACQSSEAVIALAIPTEGYTYDGTEKTPAVTVTIGTMTVADTEYTVSYTNNVNAGTATVTIEDKQGGNFAFTTQTTTFEIGKKPLTDNDVVVSISKENKTYEVSVTHGEKTLVENTDYTLGEGAGQTSGSSYNYSIPVTGKGNYTGEVMATWTAAIVAYTVKHYQQNLADNGYPTDATAIENKTGVTGDETAAETKVYKGFTAQAFSQETIAADGSTVVKIYYTRNKHNVTLPAAVAGGSITTADGTTDLKYGASITLTVTTNEGYTLKSLCATGGAALTGSGNTRTLTMADQAVSVKADWEEVKEENKTTEVTENVTIIDTNNAEVSSVEVGTETTTVTISGTVSDGTNDVPVTSIADGTFTTENTANVLSIDLSETQVDLDMDRKADSSPVKDVPDNTLIYLPAGSTMTGDNVIVKGAGSDFTCNNFVMDDEKSYNVPHPFIASNATLNREFTANQTCTVCLPYDVPAAGVHGKIYTFTSVANNQVTMTEDADGLNANVPYIFVPDGTDNISVTGSITVEIIGNNTSANDFTFKGIYEDHKFTAEEIAKGIYGFAGAKAVGTTPGHFAKAATGAYIKAKRAYLEYTGSATDLDIEGPDVSSPRFGDLDTPLPDSMDVILVDADGTTTNIGKLELVDNDDNTRYNLGGQRVGKSHKGMVIKNGKTVVVK